MQLKNYDYENLARYVKLSDKKIVIYGAGMIGQIIVPYLIERYCLEDYVDCFVDANPNKIGRIVQVGEYKYEIRSIDYICVRKKTVVLLISNSKFFEIVKCLDQIKELDELEATIVPITQISMSKNAKDIIVEKIYPKPCIPKIIHYCWFGEKKMSPFLEKCIESWREKCPDYEIKCWNQDNFDVGKYKYTKQAFESGKFGFVTDLARLDILEEYGGVYLDTDVTLLKSLDDLLYQEGFVGTEKWGNINTGGGCGFVAGHPILKEMIRYRSQFDFVLNDGGFNIETNGIYETKVFLDYGFKPDHSLQKFDGVTVYPSYVFHPYDYVSCTTQIRNATYGIHHFYGGWMEKPDLENRQNTQQAYVQMVDRMCGKRAGHEI